MIVSLWAPQNTQLLSCPGVNFDTDLFVVIGPLLLKENRKLNQKKLRKKGSSVFAFSVCPSVCLCVCVSVCSRPVGHSFWPRGWFLAWRILGWTVRNNFFCFLKFWDLTYLWLFLKFSGVFCYISFVNFERVCRSNQMT